MNDFNELIKVQSDSELLSIYIVRKDYKPEYVILLEEEIRSRDLFRERLGIENVEELTEEEIAGVIYQYLAEQEAQIKSREKATDIVEDITGKRITNYILDSIILVFLSAVIGIPWNFNEDELEGLFIIILLLYYSTGA